MMHSHIVAQERITSDFRILENGGVLSKPHDSGKTFFYFSVNTDQIGTGFEVDTPEK